MRQRTRLVINTLVNTAARFVAVAIQFVLIPFAIGILGRSYYGLWVIVGQIFAYTRLLDMGLRSAVEREVALRLSRGEPEKINPYVNTAAAYYLAAGLLVAVMTGIVAVYFGDWFKVEPEYLWSCRGMVLCAGLALALSIPQNAYAAVLSGLQRWDILSGSEVLADILRAALILALLSHVGVGGGLILMAAATAIPRLLAAFLRTLAALRLCEHVRVQPWKGQRVLLGGILGFGANSVLYMVTLAFGAQLAQILIGALMSTAEAADFAVAMLLLIGGHGFVVAFGLHARVVASKYDGEGNVRALRHLLLRSARYSGMVSLAGVIGLVVFVDPLLRLWVGGGSEYSGPEGTLLLDRIATTCRVLVLAYGLFWMQLPAHSVLTGMGRHRFPALIAVASWVVSMILVAIAASAVDANIEKVAWAMTLPIIPAFGVILPWYCCREIAQPIGAYLWEGYGIPMLGCLPAGVVGFLWNHYNPAHTWWTLIGELACCGLVLVLCGWFGVLAKDDRSPMIESVVAVYRRFLQR